MNIFIFQSAVTALTWGHNDKRLFLATGTQVHKKAITIIYYEMAIFLLIFFVLFSGSHWLDFQENSLFATPVPTEDS